MSTVLITGANRGIGLEFARQYAAAGYRVHAACRAPGSADSLASLGERVTLHALDVTDHAGIEALAAGLKNEAIDIVINNAGIYGEAQDFGKIDYAAWEEVMRVNTLAPLKMAECFLPHLEAGKMKMIASLTSRMGSIADQRCRRRLYLPLEQGGVERGGQEPRHRPRAPGDHGERLSPGLGQDRHGQPRRPDRRRDQRCRHARRHQGRRTEGFGALLRLRRRGSAVVGKGGGVGKGGALFP